MSSSWLAESIANSLQIHDRDHHHHHPTSSNINNPPSSSLNNHKEQELFNEEEDSESQLRRGEEGVKDDLSEFTETLARQIWGVASFLAHPPPPLLRQSSDPHESDDELTCEVLRNEGEIERVSNSETFFNHDDEKVVVGVTEEVLQFAMNIAHHPETWLDFPLSENEEENDGKFNVHHF